MTEKKFPYKDLSLIDLIGEVWMDIPNLEGHYVVSNFGRIKRLTFEVQCSNGQVRRLPAKIISADVRRIPNNSVKDEVYWLRAKVLRDGVKYELGIARLVYYCFVEKFAMEDMELLILAKDGDGRNLQPANLVLADPKQKADRIHQRGRMIYQRPTSYDEFMNGQVTKSSNPQCKTVSRYTKPGNKIQTFPSIAAAAAHAGVSADQIVNVLKGRQVSAGGNIWRYGAIPRVDMKTFYKEKKLHFKDLAGHKLTQYASNGKKVASYLTINDAARATNVKSSCISEALSGKLKSAGGFIWKKGWTKEQIDLDGYRFGEALRAENRQVKVKQYSLHGQYLATFPSVKSAAKHVGIAPSTLSSHLGGRGKQAGGFRWKKCK